jgi:hypothetical protein
LPPLAAPPPGLALLPLRLFVRPRISVGGRAAEPDGAEDEEASRENASTARAEDDWERLSRNMARGGGGLAG